jgi:hypothetical protein
MFSGLVRGKSFYEYSTLNLLNRFFDAVKNMDPHNNIEKMITKYFTTPRAQ